MPGRSEEFPQVSLGNEIGRRSRRVGFEENGFIDNTGRYSKDGSRFVGKEKMLHLIGRILFFLEEERGGFLLDLFGVRETFVAVAAVRSVPDPAESVGTAFADLMEDPVKGIGPFDEPDIQSGKRKESGDEEKQKKAAHVKAYSSLFLFASVLQTATD